MTDLETISMHPALTDKRIQKCLHENLRERGGGGCYDLLKSTKSIPFLFVKTAVELTSSTLAKR